MKLAELKKRFQNKYVIRIVAGVLTVAMVGSGVMIYQGKGENPVNAAAETKVTEGSSFSADVDLNQMISKTNTEVGKEETVYFLSDANGKVDQTIVMNHLYNKDNADSLVDQSELTDIENVKGKESFTQSGEKLTWKSGGKDIYYRGVTTKEAPVTQKVTYYLDGNEITPEELAGKSGKVTIRFDYTNTTSYKETLEQKEVEVCVPFVAITGMILDDSFSNIEVSNGLIKNIGNQSMLVGYALPGLRESLDVKESDFSLDVTLPDYVEVTAEVNNFSLGTAMTVVVNATDYTDLEGIDLTEIDQLVENLSDAAAKLKDGSGDLAEGLSTLDENLVDFSKGMKELQSGIKAYTDATGEVNNGIVMLKDGIGTLNESKGVLADGVTQLKEGADSLRTDGTKALLSGFQGTKKQEGLVGGSKKLSEGAHELAGGMDALLSGFQGNKKKPGLVKGAKSLSDGIDQLLVGIEQGDKTAGNPGLLEGTKALSQGAAQLDAGVDQLAKSLSKELPEATKKELQAKIKTVNEEGKTLMTAFGYAKGVTFQEKEMSTNAQEVANTLLLQKDNVIGAMLSQAFAEQIAGGLTLDQIAAAEPEMYAYAKTQSEKKYAQLVGGLYEISGAVTAAKATLTTLEASAEKLTKLTDGSEQIKNASAKIYSGVGTLDQGIKAIDSGSDQLYEGINAAFDGIKQLEDGSNALADGAKGVYAGTKKLYGGAKTVDRYLGDIDDGLTALYGKMPTLTKGIGDLDAGAKKLATGSSTLISNNVDLMKGINQLVTGTDKIDTGVDQLNEGAHTLADGLRTLSEDAIDRMVNSYNGDVKEMVNRLQAVLDAGNDYQSFSSKADDTKGSVRFIYKLASINKDE